MGDPKTWENFTSKFTYSEEEVKQRKE